MPACPTCGSTGAPCPDCETDIASWLDSAPSTDPPAQAERTCTACGYSGDMTFDGRGVTCPACHVVVPARSSEARVTQTIDCPECGLSIGVTAEAEGKTVLCPGCSYFLGTPMVRHR